MSQRGADHGGRTRLLLLLLLLHGKQAELQGEVRGGAAQERGVCGGPVLSVGGPLQQRPVLTAHLLHAEAAGAAVVRQGQLGAREQDPALWGGAGGEGQRSMRRRRRRRRSELSEEEVLTPPPLLRSRRRRSSPVRRKSSHLLLRSRGVRAALRRREETQRGADGPR